MPIADFLRSSHAKLWDAGYLRFTFVRNPYERLYSGFVQDRFAATRSPRWHAAKSTILSRVGDDFGRYVRDHVRHADRLHAWDWICWCPMHAFAFRDGALAVDVVGRAEDVPAGLAEISARLNIEIAKAPDVNVNVAPSVTLKHLDRYDRSTVEVVNELYEEDFQRFGYEMLDPGAFPIRTTLR